MKHKETIVGQVFNLSFNRKTPVRGWYLILTDEDEEYLVQRNFGFSSNFYRNIYKVDQSLKEYIVSEADYESIVQKRDSKGIGLGIAIALGALLRAIFPIQIWFGESNAQMNFTVGMTNILLTMLVLLSFYFCFCFYLRHH
ncbi:hypothetical protein ABID29_001019 [Streptococcus rupicaprae]|uniref:DUF2812 domain-containing protein n=1 Tax=Streptococcus rupicaprae TaxID=759619 RepID=A0ABV2FH84_9STRE